MSKKRFTEGLESLFADSPEETRQEVLRDTSSYKARGRKKKVSKRKTSGKNFSSDLASFLQEAFEESFEQQLSKDDSSKPATEPSSDSSAGISGLDALIRNTLKPGTLKVDPAATRRLVVAFNEAQLSKLKRIARLEKTVLKKIINEIVESYIRDYETTQGNID